MTWTITTTTTISASRAVTLAERIPSEPIKFIVLHPGTGAGGTVTIWDDLGRSVSSTRVDALSPRHEAEFYSDRRIFNISAAIDGNATLDGAGVSVYLVSREAPEPSIADGSTSFAGQVRAPGLQLTASSFTKALTSQGLRLVGWGSSSMAECSRPQRVNVRLNSTDYADGWNGFLWPAITRGIPFHMEWNGGVANTDTAQVLASIDTDLADPNFPDPSSIDAAVILPWANELPAGTSAEATEADVLAKVLALLAAYPHWKIIIAVPHSRNPVASSHAIYQSAVRVAQRIAGRDPRIAVANHYEALAPTGVDTPSTLLRADGIHLSTRGGDALYGVWAAIARWLGFVPKAPHILEGSPIMTVSGAGAVPWGSSAIASTTIAADAANEFGTPRWLLTGTAAVGNACLISNTQLLNASRPIVAGRYYRPYIDDMTIVTAAGVSTQYGPGGIVNAPSAASIRWRPLSWYAAGASQAIEAGQRVQNYYGPIIKATAEMATQTQIGLYPGAGGGRILASFASLLELP